MMDLNLIWFLLLGVLFIGYAILDGFDLGVGVLHLFTRNEKERRISMNAIGPVWDGNEVWLLTGGGALFAAFPKVYATVFSAFYLALMLLLAALIFRAVSMEFRGQVDSEIWRRFWDWAFGLSSLIVAILLGVAFANILRGIPLNENGLFTGSFWGLLNPYSILFGIFGLITLTMHGALYMTLKTDGELQERMKKWATGAWIGFVVLFLLIVTATIFVSSFLLEGLLGNPLFWILFLLLLTAIIYIPVATKAAKYFQAFIASSMAIACTLGLSAVALFPRLVPSFTDLDYSLTIYNASSTPRTLMVMLIIALIGMPIVIGYTAYIYYIFKGKVILSEESY